MKKNNIKFVAGQFLWIVGLVMLSIVGHWAFWTGFTLVTVAAFLSLRRDTRPRSLVFGAIMTLLGICCMVFFAWFSSFGAKPPPVAALVGVWLSFNIDEFNSWRKSRKENTVSDPNRGTQGPEEN
jgi:hypothetical protein